MVARARSAAAPTQLADGEQQQRDAQQLQQQ
jgi:hypothetical protein